MLKKIDIDVLSKNWDVIVIFGVLANLEQSRGWILDTDATKVMFSVIVTIFLTKTENKIKKSLTQLLQ